MSAPPRPPGRALKKKSRRPSSDRVGAPSAASLLIGAPRLTGVSQGHCMHWRRDIQMSLPPSPPGRFEMKYRVCSSEERPAFASTALELTTGPRFTGSDHAELAKDMAWSLGAAGLGSVAQATTRATR